MSFFTRQGGGRVLLLAATVMCVAAGAAVGQVDITEKFKDGRFRWYVYSRIGKTAPAPILDSDVSGITEVDVNGITVITGTRIFDLSGIEYFTKLTKLNCRSNQLTTIDVSKNSALTVLNCGANQLTALDVSKNTALTVLSCSDNQLTTLDVSKNTALEQLDCYKNQLTTLDVSKDTALTYLSCSNNQLTTLDVSKNIELTTLACSYNKLITLDVSKNTALTYLSCGRNQLTMLDVSKHTALTELSCGNNKLTTLDVSKNTALTSLDCSSEPYGGLTTLDVSKNIALTSLTCEGNPLTTLDVSKNTALTLLYCGYNQLTTLDVSKNTALKALICWDNELTTLDVSKNIALTSLHCDYNQLTTLDVSKNTALTNLGCSPQFRPCSTFSNWYRDAAYTDKWDDKISPNLTLYAKFTFSTYQSTITWNPNGGTPAPTQTSVDCGGSITAPSAMTKPGYTFNGWYTNYALTTPATFPIADVTSSKTFYAKWTLNTYKVTWEANGGTPVPTQTSVNHGNSITAPSAMTKSGYTFNDWYTDSSLTSAATFPITNVTEPKTFYVKWTINSYPVTWNTDGGTPVPTQTTVNHGSSITVPEVMTKIGYTFGGWYTNYELTTAATFPMTDVTASKTFYAKWTLNTYKITWEANGGTPVPTQTSVNHGNSITAPSTITKTGHIFGGWYTNSTFTEAATFPITNVTEPKTLCAKWIPIFTVTFNAVGGAVTPASGATRADSTLASLPTPTRGDYAFNGWFTAETGGENVTEIRKYSANTIIYAQWTQSAYTLTLDPNGGSVTPMTVRIGESGRIVSLPNPTKAGNHFGGWFTATSGGERVTEGSTINSSTTIYARWVPIYTVTFDANGGTVLPETDTTSLGGNLVSLPKPERDGYTFSGWFTTATGGTAVTVSTVFSANTKIYAQWASKAYAITFGAGTNGAITATVDGNPIVTDALIPHGKDIIFTANPTDGYEVSSWMVNGRVVAEGTKVYTLVNFSAASVVTVTFNHVDAVASPDRVIPAVRPGEESAVVAPVAPLTTEFTVGPNPAPRSSGTINFFRQGPRISPASLSIYDASGNVVCKVAVKDAAAAVSNGKRLVGSWNMKDANGRPVSDGTYLVRGVVKAKGGRSERVSLVVGVR